MVFRKSSNKYGAKQVIVDGHRFHSKREAKRYLELRALLNAGLITALELQPRIALMVNGCKIGHYVGDFRYVENGESILEDVKSPATVTDVYKLKKKILGTYDPPMIIREVFT